MDLHAPDHWRTVDFISDLHLHRAEPGTYAAWQRYMQTTAADALFILGDLFEVWVGDDVLESASAGEPGFEAGCVGLMRQTAQRLPVFLMRGNRDFLLGETLAASAGVRLLEDPCTLHFHSERIVLTHGDALCLDDTEYQNFRAVVRSPQWQSDFLAKPLAERQAIAMDLRQRSEANKAAHASYADVDTDAAAHWLRNAGARTMVHGHTHQPARHPLPDGGERWVLSDWHIHGAHARAEVLRLSAPQTAPDAERPQFVRIPAALR